MPLKLLSFIDQALSVVTRDLLIKTTYWPPCPGIIQNYVGLSLGCLSESPCSQHIQQRWNVISWPCGTWNNNLSQSFMCIACSYCREPNEGACSHWCCIISIISSITESFGSAVVLRECLSIPTVFTWQVVFSLEDRTPSLLMNHGISSYFRVIL